MVQRPFSLRPDNFHPGIHSAIPFSVLWRHSMNFTLNYSSDDTAHWANQVAKLLAQRSDEQAVQGVKDAITQFAKAQVQIAILGKAKRGKSTLINALLGRRDDLVAPIDKLPASSAITRFQWSDQEQAVVTFHDGHSESIPFEQLRQYVTEEFNRENHKRVSVVDVSGPFSGLARDMILIDTPGAASIHEHHDALLHAFIPQADAVVFLLTARMPLDQDELELLSQLKAADIPKIFFAINKIDELEEPDIAAAVQHNEAQLRQAGVSAQRIHRISAKRAFQRESALSGVDLLASEIGRFLSANKGRVLETRFVSRVKAQAVPVLVALEIELAGYRKSTAELDAELEQLRGKRQAIESERGLAEREFMRAWTVAIDQFEQGLGTAKPDVTATITHR
jgi:GTPase Era involved in 16S rRNA processing